MERVYPSIDSYFSSKTLKETTVKQYKRNIKLIKLLTNYNLEKDDFGWVNRYTTFKTAVMKQNYSLNSKRSMLITWKSVIDWLEPCLVFPRTKKDVEEDLLLYNNIVKDERAQNKCDAESTSMNELRSVIEMIEQDYDEYQWRETYHNLLTVCLYTLRPPIRLDYADMRVIRYDDSESEVVKIHDSENYLVLTDDYFYFIMNKYKTDGKYGRYYSPKYLVGSKLYKVVRFWCDTYLDKSGAFMGVYETRNKLGQRIKNIFCKYLKKNITVNTIRRTYESELIQSEEYSKMTLEEKRQLHQELLHSFETAQEYNIISTSADLGKKEAENLLEEETI